MVRRLNYFLMALLLALSMPSDAFAYLDPTSGSMLIQVIIGGLAGIALAVKLFWRGILGWFRNLKKTPQN